MKTYTGEEIKQIAKQKGLQTKTIIKGFFTEEEYITVVLKPFVTAYFLMNEKTLKYKYVYTYNAKTDKKTKTKPKGF